VLRRAVERCERGVINGSRVRWPWSCRRGARRQDRGEIATDLDPATLRLILLGAVAGPVVMPHAARKIFGLDPRDPRFQARYDSGLRQIIAHLAPGGGDRAAPGL
jgi:hypothetical protein